MNKEPDALDNNANVDDSVEALDALLRDHAERAVERAKDKMGGVLTEGTLPVFLMDGDCLRCPTTLTYSDDGLAENQFAEPVFQGSEEQLTCTLQIATRFEPHPQYLPLFVAYMAPVINYGQLADLALCEHYGASLLGLETDEYYKQLCDAFDSVSPAT